jgi:saccharopine dehydrogenase-like NADP-dependent oxidoreductase
MPLRFAKIGCHDEHDPGRKIMKDIVVIGAGKIGSTVAEMLAATGDYRVTLTDKSQDQLDRFRPPAGVTRFRLDVEDGLRLRSLLKGKYAVLSAAPFHLTIKVADVARESAAHYLDLTEDVASTRHVTKLADGAASAFIPQCGLAPGFITIAAYDMAQSFDELHDLKMRVGALPQYPSNALNYNLTWSTDGVINEYCEPCEAIVDGELREVPPLEAREEFALDGVTYEAFNTSGGLGSLCETLKGKVDNLNYKTIRYPGHAAIMKALLQDLRLRERRYILKDILENALPSTLQDVVIVFVTASGMKQGRLMQETYANKIYSQVRDGSHLSAIQVTTAAGICAALDLLASGHLPTRGFVRQEDIPLALFLANRFGRIYARADSDAPAAQDRRARLDSVA